MDIKSIKLKRLEQKFNNILSNLDKSSSKDSKVSRFPHGYEIDLYYCGDCRVLDVKHYNKTIRIDYSELLWFDIDYGLSEDDIVRLVDKRFNTDNYKMII